MSACSNTDPFQAASNNLSETAWVALHQNDWQKALEIISRIDFSLDDIQYFRLLCCTYLQAQHWNALSAIASIAADRFPAEPVFWEIWAWAEYIQGHPGSALCILESVIPAFCHRETTACILAYLYTSQGRPSEAARWLELAAQLASESRARPSESSAPTGSKKMPAQNPVYFPI